MHESLDEFEMWPDSTTDYRVIYKSLNEFEIQRDPTMDYGVGCP